MRRALHAVALTLLLFLSASAALAQGSYPLASPVSTNRFGQPIKATVAICTGNPGTSVTGCAGNLVTTYTDITNTVPCSGPAGTQFLNNQANASVGSGCSNPGTTDSSGNVLAFAASGNYWCQYYGSQIVTYVMPCQFGSSGTGGGSLGPITTGFIPVAGTGLTPSLLNSSLIENGQLVRTPEPMQAYSFTATCTDCGLDIVAGNGTNLGPAAGNGHSYWFPDSSRNDAWRMWVNGQDPVVNGAAQAEFAMPNPAGNHWRIDGFTFTGVCDLLNNAGQPGYPSANSSLIIDEDIAEAEITCDPYSLIHGISARINWGAHTYGLDVPITINQTNQMIGSGRGQAGGGIFSSGTQFQPGPNFQSHYVASAPSGYTLAASAVNEAGCGGHYLAAGTFQVELTQGPDITHETAAAQETAITIAGNECIKVTPPGSPATNVAFYNVYACVTNGCPAGNEIFQAQFTIATIGYVGQFTTPGSKGEPPGFNNTGAFITLGGSIPASGVANFGVVARDFSINCANTANFLPLAMLSSEEGSYLSRVDQYSCAGTNSQYGFIWEGYGGLGTGSSNSGVDNLTITGGAYATAGVVLDQVAKVRGLRGCSITPNTGTTPYAILAIGPNLSPVAGTTISDCHMEKAQTYGINITNGARYAVVNSNCAPNVPICMRDDSTSAPTALIGVSGGTILYHSDAMGGFQTSRSTEGSILTSALINRFITFGPVPTCTVTPPNGAGAMGTCAVATGGNNEAGKINITMAGGGETPALTITLIYGGSGLGTNGSECHFEPLSATTPWLDNTTHRITTIGTGQAVVRFLNGGGTGTAFMDGDGVSVLYGCEGY